MAITRGLLMLLVGVVICYLTACSGVRAGADDIGRAVGGAADDAGRVVHPPPVRPPHLLDEAGRAAAAESAVASRIGDDARSAIERHAVQGRIPLSGNRYILVEQAGPAVERTTKIVVGPTVAGLNLPNARKVVLAACIAKDTYEFIDEPSARRVVESIGGSATVSFRVQTLGQELQKMKYSSDVILNLTVFGLCEAV